MLKIRLSKKNFKKNIFFKIILINSKKSRDSGDILDKIGFYNPIKKKIFINIKKIKKYLKNGAKMSKTVKFLLNEFTKYNKKI